LLPPLMRLQFVVLTVAADELVAKAPATTTSACSASSSSFLSSSAPACVRRSLLAPGASPSSSPRCRRSGWRSATPRCRPSRMASTRSARSPTSSPSCVRRRPSSTTTGACSSSGSCASTQRPRCRLPPSAMHCSRSSCARAGRVDRRRRRRSPCC
jgi:hypothetical protein